MGQKENKLLLKCTKIDLPKRAAQCWCVIVFCQLSDIVIKFGDFSVKSIVPCRKQVHENAPDGGMVSANIRS
jgi:hypothetical protein